MPGFYADGEYDVAGFIVGVVERAGRRSTAGTIAPGDVADRRCRRPACTPTAIRSRGAILFEVAGLRRRRTSCRSWVRRSAMRCWRRTGRTCRSCAAARRGPGQGHGAHHRRRHHREPAADAAGRLRRRDRPRRVDACRRSSAAGRSAAAIARDEMFRAFNMGVGLVACAPPPTPSTSLETGCGRRRLSPRRLVAGHRNSRSV